jgi:small subunit ribosomal protein S8
MMTDPLADMLTRIRNANRIERPAVDMRATKLRIAVAQVLKDEGFLLDYQVGHEAAAEEGGAPEFQPQHGPDFGAFLSQQPRAILRIYLKYGPEGEKVIRRLDRASRPGRRLYRSYKQLRPVLDGLGIAVLSTSRGVMSDRRARAERVGGELLCTVY